MGHLNRSLNDPYIYGTFPKGSHDIVILFVCVNEAEISRLSVLSGRVFVTSPMQHQNHSQKIVSVV